MVWQGVIIGALGGIAAGGLFVHMLWRAVEGVADGRRSRGSMVLGATIRVLMVSAPAAALAGWSLSGCGAYLATFTAVRLVAAARVSVPRATRTDLQSGA